MNTMTDDEEIEKRRKHWETVLDGKDPIDWISDYESFKKDVNVVFAELHNKVSSLEYRLAAVEAQIAKNQSWTIQQVPGVPISSGVSASSATAPMGAGSYYGTLQGVN